MQTEDPHRKFYRFDAIRNELSPQAAELELRQPRSKARPDDADRPSERLHRHRLRGQGVRGRLPGLEALLHARLFAHHRRLRLEAARPPGPLGAVRHRTGPGRRRQRAVAELHQFCAGELSMGALNAELARFERF